MLVPPRKNRSLHSLVPALHLATLALALVVLLTSCSLPNPLSIPLRPRAASTALPAYADDAINRENGHPGTTDWIIPDDKRATVEIQAYADATSVSAGDILLFYVSVLDAGSKVSLNIYRLGWYGGTGGRLVYSSWITGQSQGYFDPVHGVLVNCHSCRTDPSTRLVEANWQPSVAVTILSTWVTGVYVAKLTEIGGKHTYVQFVVRGLSSSTYIASTADATYEAYNEWGGYSLYMGPDGSFATRASKVSFDRPNIGAGLSQGLPYEIDAIRWLERNGYDVSYVSDVDLAQRPQLLLSHRAYLNLGHDEYWSKSVRDGIEHALAAGISLAFLGANDGYWQIRYEPDNIGIGYRTIVCYKDASKDPLFGKQNDLVTTTWRDALIGRPENALIGIMYSSWSESVGFPWQLSKSAASPLLSGTGLVPGSTYGCDYVGYEWDRVFNNGRTPAGLVVLATSQVVGHDGSGDVSNTTYYNAQSKAIVFASGSIYWSSALDDYRMLTPSGCTGTSQAQPGIQRLMANVMAALLRPQK